MISECHPIVVFIYSRFSMLIQILYGGHHISNSNHLFQSLLIDFGREILSISLTRDSETFSVLIPCACPMPLAPSCGRILNLVWLLILAIYLDGPDSLSFVFLSVDSCWNVVFPWPAEADWLSMHVHYVSAQGHSHHHWEPQEASYRLGCEGVDELFRALEVPAG